MKIRICAFFDEGTSLEDGFFIFNIDSGILVLQTVKISGFKLCRSLSERNVRLCVDKICRNLIDEKSSYVFGYSVILRE